MVHCLVNCSSRSFFEVTWECLWEQFKNTLKIVQGVVNGSSLNSEEPGWSQCGKQLGLWKRWSGKFLMPKASVCTFFFFFVEMKQVEGRKGAWVSQCGRWGYRPGRKECSWRSRKEYDWAGGSIYSRSSSPPCSWLFLVSPFSPAV